MRTIICYGDSNTWGADPAGGPRFDLNTRWTGVLARELGTGYRVIEQGLNGRTTIVDDPVEPERNGLTQLMPILDSQHPFELVVIMLGTNDLKARHNRRAIDIAQSVGLLANRARASFFGPEQTPPKVLIVCPPKIAKLTDLEDMFVGALEKSEAMPRHYAWAAGYSQSEFLDASDFIVSSDLDGIHFDASEHGKLGVAVARKIESIFDSN